MERWREGQQDKQGVSAVEMWKSWREVLEEDAVVRVGKEVPRLMKHHEGEWSEEVKQLVMLSGVMRKRGESVKGITKTIKKAKARARISARSRRNKDIAYERKTNPRRGVARMLAERKRRREERRNRVIGTMALGAR